MAQTRCRIERSSSQVSFLNKIAKNLGRAPITNGITRPVWKHAPQFEVLKHATPDDLVNELQEQCKRVHTQFHLTDSKQVAHLLKQVIEELGNGQSEKDRLCYIILTRETHRK